MRRVWALWACFMVAKVAAVALRLADGPAEGLLSWRTPLALLHEDSLLLLAFGFLDGVASLLARQAGPRVGRAASAASWVLVAVVVAWTALNVPVARTLGTPLTHPMLAAVGGALGDSITHYLTAGNVLAMVAVAGAALLGALAAGRAPQRWLTLGLALSFAPALVLGPAALASVQTWGLERNAVTTLFRTTLRDRLGATTHVQPPTEPAGLPPEGPARDLTRLRGEARGKSVIWVVLESTGARFLSPWGRGPHGEDPMPHLTELLERALIFDAAYAAYPESIKGLWSYLCSGYPVASTDARRYAADRLPATCAPRPFDAAGYATALFHSGRFVYLGMSHIVRDRGFDRLADAGDIGGEHVSSFGTDDAATARALLDWIDGLSPGAPFVAFYMPIAGHHPYRSPGTGPRPFPQATERDAYINDLYAGDAALGALRDGLRRRGLLQDVVWVVMGDHGEAFGEHEGNLAHSLQIWEENVHVPLAFVVPGALNAPMRAPQVTSLVDVLPTLASLVGLEPAPDWRGHDRLAPLAGTARFYVDHGVWQMGLRQDRWKFILDAERRRGRLYDLQADPGETRDLAEQYPERARRYTADLEAWHAESTRRLSDASEGPDAAGEESAPDAAE
ncbi:MAG: sulfatase-like hydrolase/transferase [Deltaproteobacteria bacterium]|nr:sulfatase-like hydrolase/transferase [Deltaproteobacteria bacterium]MCB9786153.1 sulfatase-like hydrolase/transferase [Deltaproteobacteria bacterium]